MATVVDDMVRILQAFQDSAITFGDENIPSFAARVRDMMGMSADRKINAFVYLFDNLLTTNAQLATVIQQMQDQSVLSEVTKEDAFAALQMAITQTAMKNKGEDK